jgi:hypothetical protein
VTNYTADQLALKAHIEARNAEWVARCEAEGATFYTTTTTDLDHWAESGVFNLEQYERHCLIGEISDASKDAYGFRLRLDWDSMSLEELRDEASRVWQYAVAEAELEQEREKLDLEDFKALVQQTIDMGAGDEETALRWLTQGETFYHGQCVESWVHKQGILFTDYGRELVKRLKDLVDYVECV